MTFFEAKCQLMHIAYALREKGSSLFRVNNTLIFIGLGVAPVIILSAVVFRNQTLLTIALIVAGLLSLSNWLWTIATLVFKLNKHIEFCQNYPVKIESFLNSLSSDTTKLSSTQLNEITLKANDLLSQIQTRIEEEHFQVNDWINVLAQQKVLSTLGCTCASCQSQWKLKKYMDKKEIKAIFKKSKKRFYCQQCGQKI